ncbi:MAG: TIGR04076 family protein, partial [archaeon]|nr:TIGR04076 family protein [archaeon]
TTLNQDLIDEYIDDSYKGMGLCESFKEGQEFIIDINTLQTAKDIPEKFCIWAWSDIRQDIMHIATGGNVPGLKKDGLAITSCRDWFRPVFFKIERID